MSLNYFKVDSGFWPKRKRLKTSRGVPGDGQGMLQITPFSVARKTFFFFFQPHHCTKLGIQLKKKKKENVVYHINSLVLV